MRRRALSRCRCFYLSASPSGVRTIFTSGSKVSIQELTKLRRGNAHD